MIYGLLTETSIGKLFVAGVIPGGLGILFYLAAVRWAVFRDPAAGPAAARVPWPERLRAVRSIWAVVLLFVLVIGGLYGLFDVAPLTVMLMILGVYVLLGCVFESLSMLLLTVPVFFPLVVSLGYDPVWFGIVVVVVTEISLITPPVGLNVFVLRGVLGDVPTGTIFRGVTPFWIADLFRLALIVALPALVLVLPGRMGG